MFPVSFLPAALLLTLAVREIIFGRRDARTGASRVLPSRREAPSPPGAGWTELVQRSQQLMTHIRSEAEIAFVPLVLGILGAGNAVGPFLIASLFPLSFSDVYLVVYILPLPFLLLLIPFFLAGRGWTRSHQTLLDRQVGSLSHLEQEFFARYAGVTAGA